jgi:hypothetical protein
MLLVSNNLFRREITYPPNAVVRINLAWAHTPELLAKAVDTDHDVFLDFPIGRSKPPYNNYSLKDVYDFVQQYDNIKYVAISNVHHKGYLADAIEVFGDSVILVPKIESLEGIKNIHDIIAALPTERKVLMLDHDDLCADLIKNGIPPNDMYTVHVANLIEACNNDGAELLRTQGVVFNSQW